ncbi:MAG: hypothetical protein JXJ22_13625 [Bacteroidales bacterium]|nr:hypothetical protein [Bacteroidales bacterium]
MSNTTQRIVTILLYVIFAISLVFTGLFYFGKSVPGTEGTNYLEPTVTNAIILWAYILFGIAALIALSFPLIFIISHPKNAIKTLLIILGFVVIIGISYLIASDVPLHMPTYDGSDNVPKTVKWVGTGLNVTYILIILAIAGILVSGVSRFFKK